MADHPEVWLLPAGMDEAKQALRRTMREMTAALPEDYVRRASMLIRDRMLNLKAFRNARNVFCYVSVGKEPDTRDIIRFALSAGKQVYVPLCGPKGSMRAVRIGSLQDLKPGSFSIPEPPADAEETCAENLDLIITPCVCASRSGGRLGHGAGYYDRFLEKNRPFTVCLCFSLLIREDIPLTELDAVMDLVMTEESAFYSGR